MKQFEILAMNPPGWAGAALPLAALRDGRDACLNLEYAAADAARRLVAELVAAGGPFSAAVTRWDARVAQLLEPAAAPNLRSVILCQQDPAGLAAAVAQVRRGGRRALVEVRSLAEARAAQGAGAEGLVVKGNEAGGLVGEETTLVLLQRVLAAVRLPVWVRGGVGEFTAAACLASGACGVLLDWQLALAAETDLPAAVRGRLTRMEGQDSVILGQDLGRRYRVYGRPTESAFKELRELNARLTVAHGPAESTRAAWQAEVERKITPAGDGLLLFGQDAAFAAPLAERYRTVGGICRAIERAARTQVDLAARHRALAPGGPLAESHGTRYPIVQGPMTRVSDVSDFAAAVADGGALPFLALALLRGPQVRELLAATRARLGERPWGVGILGFVPHELREEQLAEVLRSTPPYAIIAGGRPDQAASLEREGIRTYLHVPSPGLLRMFLESGSRRVIFEGRECGGHVGPCSSFVLWEQAVRVMLEHLSARDARGGDYHVLFAGGIHDARSAAMVAALAAPLTERGVRIGVLMGTAYLFTREVVAAGAIQEGFQREALACTETALLESGVGHATRCAVTPFVDQFTAARRELLQSGRAAEEIREVLETLNLGRLRIASKGLVRRRPGGSPLDRSTYEHVDDRRQHAEGMYMIGQVAALRQETCTVSELHEDVSAGGARMLAEGTAPAPAPTPGGSGRPSDVAIIGMACLLPKADNPREYWHNILNQEICYSEVPADRWDWKLYFNADRTARDKSYSKWGGFLKDVPFDPARYGMPPNTLRSIEPLQLLVLEVCQRALADAGYAERPFDRERAGVVLGAGGGVADMGLGYGFRALLPHFLTQAGGTGADAAAVLERLNGRLPEWTEDSFPGLLLNVLAGRVANRLDLGGANFTVDAACASSLAAVYLGVQALETGDADMVLVGGADTMQSPFAYLCFSKTQALSPTGRSCPFDNSSDGIVISEGVAVAVLKRLADAQRDGDRVYAVLKGLGSSSDGRDKGLTAPRPAGQMRALRRAYAKAGFSPATVGLFEAHGTGTVVGDQAEAETLTTVLKEAQAPRQSCALGSVKSQIGHTKCSAGVAGLIKAALALHHKVLPPTRGIEKPNIKADFASGPVYLNSAARPWLRRLDGGPRRAAVSAFGFGGTNFHAVLEEYPAGAAPAPGTAPQESSPVHAWPAELFIWRGTMPQDIAASAARLEAALSDGARPLLRDLAAAVCTRSAQSEGRCCLAVVAESLEDLAHKLGLARGYLAKGSPQVRDPRGIYYSNAADDAAARIAFVYPGQGAQRANMLCELALAFPAVREVFEAADRALGERLEHPLSHYVFPIPKFTEEDKRTDEVELTQTNVAQPAIGAANLAMHRVLSDLGIHPALACGHSYGEYVALWAAGVLEADDLIRISEARGRFIVDSTANSPGTMAAADADESTVRNAIRTVDGVWIANLNSPAQTVISGTETGIAAAIRRLEALGVTARPVRVSRAFHTELVAGAKKPFQRFLDEVSFRAPRFAVYSNTTAAPHSDDPVIIRRQLVEHLISPVRFADEVLSMYEAGARIFIEVGPGKILTSLIETTLNGLPCTAVSLDQPGRNGLLQLVHALGQLAVAGVRLAPAALFHQRTERLLDIDKLIEQTRPVPPAPTTWMVNGSRAVPLNGKAVRGSAPPAAETGPGLRITIGAEIKDAPTMKTTTPTTVTTPVTAGEARAGHVSSGPPSTAPLVRAAPVTPVAGPEPLVVPAGGTGGVEAVMSGYHQLMMKFLDTQRNIMLSFLGQSAEVAAPYVAEAFSPAAALPAPVAEVPAVPIRPAAPTSTTDSTALPAAAAAVRVVPAAAASPAAVEVARPAPPVATPPQSPAAPARVPAPEPVAAAAPVATPSVPSSDGLRASLQARLIEVVADRTGYPPEMLDINLDMEADLGIDSIKRIEILGSLQKDAALPTGATEGGMDELARLKTLAAIIDWIVARTGATTDVAPTAVTATAAPAAPIVAAAAPVVVEPEVASVPASVSGPAPAESDDGRRAEFTRQLLEVVSDRTGYPLEMLELDLDLEADLGVDSIKRVEILGTLQKQAVLPGGDSGGSMEELARLKTLRAIIDWVAARATAAAPTAVPAPSAAQPAAVQVPAEADSVPRMAVAMVEAGALEGPSDPFDGAVVITDDGAGVAAALTRRLRGDGVPTVLIRHAGRPASPEESVEVDLLSPAAVEEATERVRSAHRRIAALVHLLPARPADIGTETPGSWRAGLDIELRSLFLLARALGRDLRAGPSGRLLTATRMDGAFGFAEQGAGPGFQPVHGAVGGVVKSLAWEWPEVHSKSLDFEAAAASDEVAAAVYAELTTTDRQVEIGYCGGRRVTLQPCLAPAPVAMVDPHLDRSSVVMVVGGARGITAEIALELAERFGPTLLLVGRALLPEDIEDQATAGITDVRALKSVLKSRLETGGERVTPARIEAAYHRLQHEREMRGNLARMRAAGAVVHYYSTDFSDAAAVARLLADVYARHGRIDGVIYGAGVTEDKFIADKTPESFERVISAKVNGALALAEGLRPEHLRFLYLFSSVSGRYGNRGQSDYAAANEVLNKLAWWLHARWPGRVAALNWGPWESSGGMVSPELARKFAEAGIRMISRPAGRAAFLRELLSGAAGPAEVLLGGPLQVRTVAHGESTGRGSAEVGSEPAPFTPLLAGQAHVLRSPTGTVEVWRTLDTAYDLYLLDHQLDGRAVMPMAMMLELLAEVAGLCCPDMHLAAVRDVRIFRGITFEQKTVRVRVQARRHDEAPGVALVELRADLGATGPLHYAATAEMHAATAAIPHTRPWDLVNARPLSLSVDEAYKRWLFHGPIFAGITEVEAVGDNGIRARLQPSSPQRCLGGAVSETWLIDPVIVDSSLQMLILWARTYLDSTPLPARLGCYHRFGPTPREDVRCQVRIRSAEGPTLCADIELFDAAGRLFGRLEDMEVTCSRELNRLAGAAAG